MKKLTFVLAVVLLASSATFAQKEKKPKINNALKNMQEGNLAEAKEEIDLATEHEKTKDDGKTWYYRGLIYAVIDTTNSDLADGALETAMESFKKADELEKGSSGYYVTGANGLPELKEQQIENLWGAYLNKGVTYFQAEESEDAVKNFAKCAIVKPQDTTAYLYAGLAAQSGESYDTAIKYFKKYFEVGGTGEDVYASMIYITGTIKEDKEGALEMVREARQKFPSNTTFPKQEIDLLIQLDKVDEAKTGLLETIEKEPDNPQLYFSLGVMYDQLKEVDNARDAYEKSLEIDPEFYNSRFNLAVMFYNEAVEVVKEKNALGITAADQKKAKELQVKVDEKLKSALPHWEKLYESNSEDQTTLETLKYIYVQTKQMNKAEEIQAKMDELGFE